MAVDEVNNALEVKSERDLTRLERLRLMARLTLHVLVAVRDRKRSVSVRD